MNYRDYAIADLPPGGRPLGPAWQRRMNLWMPDWQQRQAELAEVGRHCWLGDHKERAG